MIRVHAAKAGALLVSLGNSLGDEPLSRGASSFVRLAKRQMRDKEAAAQDHRQGVWRCHILKTKEAGPHIPLPHWSRSQTQVAGVAVLNCARIEENPWQSPEQAKRPK